MADWKVSRERVELFKHPNADRLDLIRLGQYQCVCQKGLHKDGNIVIFIPNKSILPDEPQYDGFKQYLAGEHKNRVRSQNMRGELSCGIVIPDKEEFKDIPLGQDISELLHINHYEPPVPAQLIGKIKPIGNIDTQGHTLTHHDAFQFSIYLDEFSENEEVICSEKVHGSQLIVIRTVDNRHLISSKGMFKRRWTVEEAEDNTYWRAVKNVKLFEHLDIEYPNRHIQVFGEVIPVQRGYTYGCVEPEVVIFRVEIDGENLSLDDVDEYFKSRWVPILYRGPLNIEHIRKLAKGREQISGEELHIREGLVVSPIKPRISKKGNFPLYLKVINPDYKETGEEFN